MQSAIVSTPSSAAASVSVSPIPPSLPSTSSGSCVENTTNIPTHWRPEVEYCIEEKCLTESARSDIVRTLVSLLFMKSKKPRKDQCEDLARKLILQYPFARDDLGNGYVSTITM